jgi:hypothetical protein
MDVSDPQGPDVMAYAATIPACETTTTASLDGTWSSRWNGGVDATIAGDTAETWKAGRAEIVSRDDRVYIFFDWDNGKRKGLLEVRRENANRLVGKYLNVTNPVISRPWVGHVIGADRLDGTFPGGRLEFSRA